MTSDPHTPADAPDGGEPVTSSKDDVATGVWLCVALNVLPAMAILFAWQMIKRNSPGAGLYETIRVFWTVLPFLPMIYVLVAISVLMVAMANGRKATLGFVLPIAAFGALVALDAYLH